MTAAQTTFVAPAGAWRHPRVLSWLVAEVMSLVGDQIYFVALAWVAVSTGGPSAVGVVLIAAAIPRGVFMILGGTAADRLGPRRIAIASDLFRVMVMLATAAIVLQEGVSVTLLAVVAAVFGTVDALYYPASGSLPAVLVPARDLMRLQNLRNVGTRAALILGAPLGGVVIATSSLAIAFTLNAVTFLVSAAALAFTRTRAVWRTARNEEEGSPPYQVDTDGGFVAQTRSGLVYAYGHPTIRGLLILVALFEFGFNGAVNIGLPTLAQEEHWGSEGYGIVVAAIGIGAAAVAGVLAMMGSVRSKRQALVGASGIGALSLGLMGAADSLLVAACLAAGLGVAGGLIAGVAVPTLQETSSPDLLGRVMSLFALSTIGLAPLSLAAAGAVASLAGVPATLAIAASLVLLAGAFTAMSVATESD